MMNEQGYIVKVLPAEGCHPEFAPEGRILEGIECSGFLLAAIDENGAPIVEAIYGMSVRNISDLLQMFISKIGPEIRQACAIAEGHLKAKEIQRKKEIEDKVEGFADFLKTFEEADR